MPTQTKRFQSTPPARGATAQAFCFQTRQPNFNPRPPRGGRLTPNLSVLTMATFQSTPPARGATGRRVGINDMTKISIHAPREGGDGHLRPAALRRDRISIHAPREGGDVDGRQDPHERLISIHAPREGGDGIFVCPRPTPDISIHAPREGGDSVFTSST